MGKESQISFCFQDFNENFARQLEDRSRKPYQPKNHDFGSLRNPWSMHMGTRNKRCLNLSSFDYELRTIHTVCFQNVIEIQGQKNLSLILKIEIKSNSRKTTSYGTNLLIYKPFVTSKFFREITRILLINSKGLRCNLSEYLGFLTFKKQNLKLGHTFLGFSLRSVQNANLYANEMLVFVLL